MNSDSNDFEIEKELKKLGYWNDIYTQNNYFGTGPTILANFAKNLIEKYSIHDILELGCGQGRDCTFFASLNCNVVATDISENAINFVKNIKNEKKLDNLELFVHDSTKPMNFKNEMFDLVYSNLAFQFFDHNQLSEIFKNIKKVMKNDSFFLFSTKKSGDKYYNFGNKVSENAFEYKGITRFFFDKIELEKILKKYFSIVTFEEDTHTNLDNTTSVWWKILVKK